MSNSYTSFPIVESHTAVFPSAADVEDVRGKAVILDENGCAAVATGGSTSILGIALLCAGATNRVSGNGKVKKGEDIDIQISAMGYANAGADIAPGQALTADANGDLVPSKAGDYVIATALRAAGVGGKVFCQITKYVGGAAPAASQDGPKTE